VSVLGNNLSQTRNACMHGKAQRVARRCKRVWKTKGYWTKVHQIFIRRRGVIHGVNARIRVAILSVLKWQHTEWRWGMTISPIGAHNRSP